MPYLSNLENDVGFGYTGKFFDSATGLYDYGSRDYSPNSARITTIDPVRDGNNWFGYVVASPVNFLDPWGLSAIEAGNNTLLKIQETNAELKALTYGKYLVSGAMIAEGILTGNPLLVAGGVLLSQVPTGRVVNKTGQDIMMHPETRDMGSAYFGANSTTYTQWDGDATPGPDSKITKTSRFSDATIVERNDEIVTELSLGTKVINGLANLYKTARKALNLGGSNELYNDYSVKMVITEQVPNGLYFDWLGKAFQTDSDYFGTENYELYKPKE